MTRFRRLSAALVLVGMLHSIVAHAEQADDGSLARWHVGPRIGLTAAVADGFGFYSRFDRYYLGFDGAAGVNFGYRLTSRSPWFAEWMVLFSRMYVHGVTVDGDLLSERIPYLQIVPFMLRYESKPMHVAFGPWVGRALFKDSLGHGYSLNPILAAMAFELGVGIPAGPGSVTASLMLQPIFHAYANEDGGSWLEPAILFVGYEW